MNNLKKRITKKVILVGAKICHEHGYYSKELTSYLNKFQPDSRIKLSTILNSVYVGHNTKSSRYYNFIKENNLI